MLQKVRTRYNAAPTKSATLEQLVENEKGEKKRTATEGLMWLIRGLSFTCKALQNLQANKSEELAPAFSKSYEVTLKKFHNFVVKGVFAVRISSFFFSWGEREHLITSLYFSYAHLNLGRNEGMSLPCRLFCQAGCGSKW